MFNLVFFISRPLNS